MKRGLVVLFVAILVLAVAVPAVLALTDNQKTEMEALYEQEYGIRQQILDKQEEFGLIDVEEAQTLRERLAQMWEVRKERMAEGNYFFGFGRGNCHGSDSGRTGVMGRGGMMF